MSEQLAMSFAQCEQVIERGLATFVDVGQALLRIRDERMYRQQGHDTFEGYCRNRWGFSDEYARLQMRASEVATAPTMVGLAVGPPKSERHARELTPLRSDPERMAEAWTEAAETARAEDRPVTASDVREAVTPRRSLDVHYSSATDEWATPRPLFDALDREFGFTLDVCALDSSAKCERYFTPETDGLAHDWRGTCWMNPPYGGEIVYWIQKAHESAHDGATVVCLVPARVDTGWWWDHCRHGEVRFIKGRLRFGDAATGAPFPSAVVVFRPDGLPSTSYWKPEMEEVVRDAA